LKIFVLSIFGIFFSHLFKQQDARAFYITGYAQGTTYHITYYAKDSIVTKNSIDAIMQNIDNSLSDYNPNSLLSKFNNSVSGVQTDKYLKEVVGRSLKIFKETGGIFDITVYPLVRAWGFGPSAVSAMPDAAAIQAIMPCVGSQKIHLNGDRLTKDVPCVKIDVNGIAQGYSVDIVANFLEKKGIRNYLVEIGGELRVKGRRQPDGTLMQIGIESPAENSFTEPVIQKIIQLDKGAVTTSGNYRKYIQYDNKKISHLMDPKTGYPIQNEMISVTVIAKDAITADGYDNALMGMGLIRAKIFVEEHKNMEAYFIYHKEDGSVADTATKGFYKLVRKSEKSESQ